MCEAVERDLKNIEREQRTIKRKILRVEETGDIRRLLCIRDQLGRIREDLERMNRDYKPPKLAFRKSYGYEVFVENILTGRKG